MKWTAGGVATLAVAPTVRAAGPGPSSPPVFAQAAGKDLFYVGAEPPRSDSSALLVEPGSGLKTLAGPRGRRIAVQKGSSAHFLVVQAVAKAGLAWKDITPIHLPPADARARPSRKAPSRSGRSGTRTTLPQRAPAVRGCDAPTRIEMQQLIESLWPEHGFTALLVTHDVSEAVALADRVLLIEDGRIAMDERLRLARPRSRGRAQFAAIEDQVLQRVFMAPLHAVTCSAHA